jgi:ADP-ribose pyrophosphatase YjhB (NUDIX family)
MTTKYETARYAVCCLLMNQDNKILAISRGEDRESWGLPGGKVENNESLHVAVVRETFEETGIVIADPQSVYTAFVPGRSNFICTTFIASVAHMPEVLKSEPFEGYVEWVSPQVLMQEPYAKYNTALFEHLNIPVNA